MALPAGRVGVKKTDVDWQGNVKGGGSTDTYTKQQIDNKFGGLTFRDNEGTPQVKTSDGEWVNFNSGGGFEGFKVPADLINAQYFRNGDYTTFESGGCYETEDKIYIDITVVATTTRTSDSYSTTLSYNRNDVPMPNTKGATGKNYSIGAEFEGNDAYGSASLYKSSVNAYTITLSNYMISNGKRIRLFGVIDKI